MGVYYKFWVGYEFIFKFILVFEIPIEQELDVGAIDKLDHDLDGGIDFLDGLIDKDTFGIMHFIKRLPSLRLVIIDILSEDDSLICIAYICPHEIFWHQRWPFDEYDLGKSIDEIPDSSRLL